MPLYTWGLWKRGRPASLLTSRKMMWFHLWCWAKQTTGGRELINRIFHWPNVGGKVILVAMVLRGKVYGLGDGRKRKRLGDQKKSCYRKKKRAHYLRSHRGDGHGREVGGGGGWEP